MLKRFTLLLILLWGGLIKADPPPPVQVICEQVIAGLRQQLGSTNIVLTSNVDKTLKLRISKNYEIFDSKGKLVKKGNGKEIDVSDLAPGKYTIKFDKDYNQIEYFTKN